MTKYDVLLASGDWITGVERYPSALTNSNSNLTWTGILAGNGELWMVRITNVVAIVQAKVNEDDPESLDDMELSVDYGSYNARYPYVDSEFPGYIRDVDRVRPLYKPLDFD